MDKIVFRKKLIPHDFYKSMERTSPQVRILAKDKIVLHPWAATITGQWMVKRRILLKVQEDHQVPDSLFSGISGGIAIPIPPTVKSTFLAGRVLVNFTIDMS